MARRRNRNLPGAMLDAWRPPGGAGDPLGCLATTYTFDSGLFDEQCLARFLEVEADPQREDLAFRLERETRLGAAYVGVLVDHTQAGVEHSLRWDVLPVRLRSAKQHAKLSLLAWANHVRIVVTSANLTVPGYRINHEVSIAIESTPTSLRAEEIREASEFLRRLLTFVPGAGPEAAEVRRAVAFLDRVEQRVSDWIPVKPVPGERQHLVFTLPGRGDDPVRGGPGFDGQGSLEQALARCARHGGAPDEVRVASPFFDQSEGRDAATHALCKAMARGTTRQLRLGVPAIGDFDANAVRLAAPASLVRTAGDLSTETTVEILPSRDADGNDRAWHAKMLGLRRRTGNGYTGLMIGSSNFTKAGLGVDGIRNAEANVLTIADHRPHARSPGRLDEVWPTMIEVANHWAVEWQGAMEELDEEQRETTSPVPEGFLSATYEAGERRAIVLRFDVDRLPVDWTISSTSPDQRLPKTLLTSVRFTELGRPPVTTVEWDSTHTPGTLLVGWTNDEGEALEAFLPLNVENAQELPPPTELREMSADDMLLQLAASDPGAALRLWARRREGDGAYDEVLDSTMPPELDPLRRYDLKATFLRRVRSRARVLARLRRNLERPVWGRLALQWRLEGFIGVRPLAVRMLREVAEADGAAGESLLMLADLVILLGEVEYEPTDGSLGGAEFEAVYRPFLAGLVEDLNRGLHGHRGRIGPELSTFWKDVVDRCRN